MFLEHQKQRSKQKTQDPNLFLIHLLPNIEPPLYQTPHIYPHSFTELRNVCCVGSARWRTTNVFATSEPEEQCVRIRLTLCA
jgi:hypothetical protein